MTLAVVQRDFDNDRAIEQTARIAAEFGTPLVVPEYIFESVKAGQRLATRAFEVPTSALLSRPSLQQSNSASQIRIEPARPNMKRFHSFQITKGSEEHQHASVTQRATDPRRGSLGSSSRKRSGSPRQGNAVGVQNYYLGGTKSKTEASSSESSGDEGTEDEDMAPRSPDDSKAAPSTSSGGEREAAVPEGLTSDASAVKGEGEQNGEADGKDSTGKKAPQPRQPPPVPKSAPPDLAPLKKESTKDVGVSGKSRPLKAAMPPLNLAAQPSPVLTPGKRERLEWQAMLSSVLNGDVIRSEKQRLGSTDSTRKRGDPEERLAIWLGVKAATSGRRVDDERKFLEEFRKTEVDSILEEVVRFEVREGTGIPSAFEQVVAILDKVDLVESLYPSRRAITADKPIYASLSFQYNLDALVSWLSITRALRMQLQILKNWTGSETLSMMGGDRSFIERILKESGVKGTFERRIMSVLKGMVRRTKQAMTNNAAAFRRMRLPTHIDELRQLAQFPSNLLEEFLKLRLEYTENLIKPVGAGGMGAIAELVEDSSISLGLAARIKEETIDLDTPADGWTITNSLSTTYDSVFLASLRFYFRLLSWRLRSSAEIVFFKEVEMLETEWEFLTEQVAPWLEGGDVEIAEQFCKLEEELLRKVNAYFQAQMNVAPGSLSPQSAPADVEGPSGGLAVPPIPSINNPQVNLARWYKSRVLENVRARSRKLLRFMKSLISEFELASEYLLVDLDEVIRKLQATDHILVDVTGTGKGVTPQGYLVFASPSLQDRHTAVRKLLRACLTRYENFREDVGEGYVLVVSPGQNKHITWRGGKVMKLNDPGSAKGYRLKSERIRLIADTGELLAACRRAFEHAVGVVAVRLKKESRAHLHSVHMALKGVKRTLYNLTEVVISSVRGVRDLIRKMNHGRSTDMGVVHDLIQEWFTFASDFGSKALRNVGGTTKRKIIQRSFVRLGIDWLDFVVVDCVNTDKRTYRWSLVALEFALKITAGNGILDLTDEEFGMFKFQVARCMSLLISHVDIQGTRQFALSASVKLESERATSEAMSDLIRGEIARLLQGGGVPSIAEHPSAAFLELEEERQKRQRGMRVIGKVLDDRNIEERNIGLLASSSSSISLRWQQGKFLGGGSYGSVSL